MKKPILFLLKPNFSDAKLSSTARYFCPDSALLEGVLKYYPQLYEHLDIRYIEFERPRHELIAFTDKDNQECPVLLVPKGKSSDITEYEWLNFLPAILNYFSKEYDIAIPH